MARYFCNGNYILGNNLNSGNGLGPLAMMELMASPTDSPMILEVSFTVYGIFSGVLALGLGVPPSQGLNPYYFGIVSDTTDSSVVGSRPALRVATGWRVPPPIPSKFLRRISARVYGATDVVVPTGWKFPRGICLAPSTSLVLYNTVINAFGRIFVGSYTVEWDN